MQVVGFWNPMQFFDWSGAGIFQRSLAKNELVKFHSEIQGVQLPRGGSEMKSRRRAVRGNAAS